MSGTHSLFAPSADERHIDCPASLVLNAAMPESTSIYAEVGTLAHWVGDQCWKNSQPPSDYLGFMRLVSINGVSQELFVDDEMVENVDAYLNWCREVPGDHYPEHKVDVTAWCPPAHMLKAHPKLPQAERQFGTCDHAVCAPGVLTIVDFKYGEGVQVWAEENPQLIKYALGMVGAYNAYYDFQKIVIRICQPRLDHYDEWVTDIGTLRSLGAGIKQALIATLLPNPKFGPSERACKFCKVRATCGALAAKINGTRALAFDDLTQDFEPTGLLSVGDLVEAWKVRKLYEIRINAIQEELDRLLLGGQKVPGLKLVDGRSIRRWRSEAAAHEVMSLTAIPDAMRYTKKLIGPAAAEKLIPAARRQLLTEAIVRPAGKPTLVDENDPRPEHGSGYATAFDDIDDEATE